MSALVDRRLVVLRVVWLCVQLVSGCASLEQAPAGTLANESTVSEVHSKSVGDMLAFGGYGMLKGAATGALVGWESPVGPFGMIVTVPAGALFDLVGGMASPSMQAVSEWRIVPETNPWPTHQHDAKPRREKVVVVSAPPAPPAPKPVRVHKPKREEHAHSRPAQHTHEHKASGHKSSGAGEKKREK